MLFALTIHKMQGLSMSMITVSLDANIFSEGQAYTAISRAGRLEGVCIAALDWSAFKVDQAAVREYQRLEEVSKSLQSSCKLIGMGKWEGNTVILMSR